jgi:competence protein ComEA
MNRIALLLAAIVLPTGVALASVDVNTATKAQLEAEGIGPAVAQAIVDYRTRNGPFSSPEQVRKVVIEAIAPKLHIGISISGTPDAAKEKSADARPAPAPDAKAASATGNSKPAEKPAAKDDPKRESVREQKTKDQDDRKT